MTSRQGAAVDPTAVAIEHARALALAIGECAAFRAFEAAQEAMDADADLGARLAEAQRQEQELRLSRAWGGATPEDERALERVWQDLASRPALTAHMAARDELLALLREVSAMIGDGVGLDFGAACAPAGGCC